MTDEVKTEQEEVQPQAESQPAEETAQDAEVETQGDTDLAQDTNSAVNEEAPKEQEKKPTRAERRIKDLAAKLAEAKKQGQPQYGYDWPEPQLNPSEDGTITPDQLDQYITAKANKIVEARLGMAQQQTEYQRQVEDYLSDLEATANQIEVDFKDNPEVAQQVNDLLTEINKSANIAENGQLVPRIKTSDLYKKLKNTLSTTKSVGKSEVTATLAKQVAEGAITPSTRQSEQQDYSNMSIQDIWSNPASVRETLRAKLPIAQE